MTSVKSGSDWEVGEQFKTKNDDPGEDEMVVEGDDGDDVMRSVEGGAGAGMGGDDGGGDGCIGVGGGSGSGSSLDLGKMKFSQKGCSFVDKQCEVLTEIKAPSLISKKPQSTEMIGGSNKDTVPGNTQGMLKQISLVGVRGADKL